MGRPTSYSEKVAELICNRLAGGESLNVICQDARLPARSTIYVWLTRDTEGFQDKYARAREAQTHFMADEILEISDRERLGERVTTKADGGVETVIVDQVDRSRLQVDSRKWLMARMAPKKWGDKTALQLTGKDEGPVEVTSPRDRISERLTQIAGRISCDAGVKTTE